MNKNKISRLIPVVDGEVENVVAVELCAQGLLYNKDLWIIQWKNEFMEKKEKVGFIIIFRLG